MVSIMAMTREEGSLQAQDMAYRETKVIVGAEIQDIAFPLLHLYGCCLGCSDDPLVFPRPCSANAVQLLAQGGSQVACCAAAASPAQGQCTPKESTPHLSTKL